MTVARQETAAFASAVVSILMQTLFLTYRQCHNTEAAMLQIQAVQRVFLANVSLNRPALRSVYDQEPVSLFQNIT